MNHELMQEKIWTLDDPELSLQERQEIEQHLTSCSDCAGKIAQLNSLQSRLKDFKLNENPAFTFKVMERLHEKTGGKLSQGSLLGFIPKWILPALGYGFAFFLMWSAIETRQPWITTQSVLLADVPAQAQWQYTQESPDLNNIVPTNGEISS